MTVQDIIAALETIVERDKADGCHGCAFSGTEEWETPCCKCKRNSKDYWRPGYKEKKE